VADGLPGIQRAEILSLCDEVDYLSNQLNDLCRRGMGSSPKAQEIAKYVFSFPVSPYKIAEKLKRVVYIRATLCNNR
jgi:hypothetical protein